MRIVTNPGSNLSPEAIARHGVLILPQQIVVDGVQHDTREAMTQADVDRWVKGAREHPHVLGTSAAEFVEVFRKVGREDRQILAVQTSRKLIGSYAAAVSAARTLRAQPGYEDMEIEVVDTLATDMGAGLVTLFAGESMLAGRTLAQTAEDARRFAEGGHTVLTLDTLDSMVRSGRATFLRAWVANLLNVAPIISFVDGELALVGRTARVPDKTVPFVDAVVKKLGAGRKVWCAVVHGGHPDRAARVLAGLREKLDVVHAVERPFSASIYLHVGKGALGAFVYPVDRLPWAPPPPPAR